MLSQISSIRRSAGSTKFAFDLKYLLHLESADFITYHVIYDGCDVAVLRKQVLSVPSTQYSHKYFLNVFFCHVAVPLTFSRIRCSYSAVIGYIFRPYN